MQMKGNWNRPSRGEIFFRVCHDGVCECVKSFAKSWHRQSFHISLLFFSFDYGLKNLSMITSGPSSTSWKKKIQTSVPQLAQVGYNFAFRKEVLRTANARWNIKTHHSLAGKFSCYNFI